MIDQISDTTQDRSDNDSRVASQPFKTKNKAS